MSYNMAMTFNTKIFEAKKYIYFQAGRKSMYNSLKKNPEKVNLKNVTKDLDCVWGRAKHYLKSIDDLLPLLSEHLYKKHMAKKTSKLCVRAVTYDDTYDKRSRGRFT